ncbi:MAG: carboxypeptidase-like regulatory domain-containing protein [Candidatus Aenigmatarchaeota archaeon]
MRIFLFLLFLIFSYAPIIEAFEIEPMVTIPLSDKAIDISIMSEKGIMAAVSKESRTLYLIDIQTGLMKKYRLSDIPSGVVFNKKEDEVIIIFANGLIRFFSMKTEEFIKEINLKVYARSNEVSPGPYSIAINQNTNTLYIAQNNNLLLLDIETGGFIKEFSLPAPIISMDIDSGLGYLMVLMKDGLSVYKAETLEMIKMLQFDGSKTDISVNPSTHIGIITDSLANELIIISLEPEIAILARSNILEMPESISVEPFNNIAFASYKDGVALLKLENPLPRINSLIPSGVRAGEGNLYLSVEGERFTKDSTVRFNLKEIPTSFLSNEKLRALLFSDDLKVPGNIPVTVDNPPPGGGTSNVINFRIYTPPPVIESIWPDTIYLLEAGETVKINVRGKNFLNGSKVNLNGETLKTRFISSILLEAELNQSVIKIPGEYIILVINPFPETFTSNPSYLKVKMKKDGHEIVTGENTFTDTARDNVSKKGKGILIGRILNTDERPVQGVTVRIKNQIAITDSNGFFRLEGLPAGKQHLIIDGSTATDYSSRYPTIPFTINIEANRINEMPFTIYLHKQKNYNFKEITPDEDTILTDPEVPGFEMRIPKGVKITGWDGKPNKRVSVRTVPTDRLPVKPLPDNAYVKTIYMFYFDKIGGGIPDEPIPVKFPNDLGLLPGQKAIIWYYDESPNEGEAPNDWAIAGTGTVTPDGRYIISDPGVGIPKFCCGATGPGCPGPCPAGPGPGGGCPH